MPPQQVKETLEEQRTREYRQLASHLASAATLQARGSDSFNDATKSSSSSSSRLHMLPSVRAAQHLLTNHPGWIPMELLDGKMDENVDDDTTTRSSRKAVREDGQIILPCCSHCGGPLQPGVQNTTVRLLHMGGRSRSQRRRLSRRTARIHQARKKQGRQTNSPPLSRLGYFVRENFGGKDDTQCGSTFHKLEQVAARNVLQIRCGACGGHSQLPGYSKKQRVTKTPKEAPTWTAAAPVVGADSATVVDPTADFVSLSASGKTKEKGNKRQTVAMISSGGQKKKKKRDPKNKNKLLNFLSSLNDH